MEEKPSQAIFKCSAGVATPAKARNGESDLTANLYLVDSSFSSALFANHIDIPQFN